jgi:periplasmic protein TonB
MRILTAFLLISFVSLPGMSQDVTPSEAESAVSFLAKTFANNTLAPREGQLAEGGKWLLSTHLTLPAPVECEKQRCIEVIYQAAAPAQDCRWLIRLSAGNGETPLVLAENDDASMRTIRVAFPAGSQEEIHNAKASYPPIAVAAHVSGDVLIGVIVDAKGRITNKQVLSGPNMLKGAALISLDKASFDPLSLGGKPISWRGIIHESFKTSGPPNATVAITVELPSDARTSGNS